MSEVAVYNLSGEKVADLKLPKAVFGAKVNMDLVTQALYVYAFNQREFNANTKVRGEIRGGGRKPWAQKHTGRARQGSTRSAQWKGGARVFGPRSVSRDAKKITRKMRANAIRSILSLRATENKVLILDSIDMVKPNTKSIKIGLSRIIADARPVIVSHDANSNFNKSIINVPGWNTIYIDNLNIFDLASSDLVVMPRTVVEILANRYPEAKKKSPKVETKSPVEVVTAKNEDKPKRKIPVRKRSTQKVASLASANQKV
jgi:large subunit ribosomal protein L4